MEVNRKMKQKYQWPLLILAILVVAVATGYIKVPALGATTGAPEGAASTLMVTCYDTDNGVANGKVPAEYDIQVGGNSIAGGTTATGTVTLDKNQALLPGQAVTVMCRNNTDDGYYRNDVSATLVAGPNSVAVPMKKVGDVKVTATSSTVAVGANDYASYEYDMSTDTIREYFYKPIITLADCNSTDQVFATGEITDVVFSGGNKIACDTDAGMTGQSFCGQLDQEWVSSKDVISKAKIWFQSGSTNAAGCMALHVYDGVPFAGAGVASVNRANAYDTDNYAATNITIT